MCCTKDPGQPNKSKKKKDQAGLESDSKEETPRLIDVPPVPRGQIHSLRELSPPPASLPGAPTAAHLSPGMSPQSAPGKGLPEEKIQDLVKGGGGTFLTHWVTGSFPKRALTREIQVLPLQVSCSKVTPNGMTPFCLGPCLGSGSHPLG